MIRCKFTTENSIYLVEHDNPTLRFMGLPRNTPQEVISQRLAYGDWTDLVSYHFEPDRDNRTCLRLFTPDSVNGIFSSPLTLWELELEQHGELPVTPFFFHFDQGIPVMYDDDEEDVDVG